LLKIKISIDEVVNVATVIIYPQKGLEQPRRWDKFKKMDAHLWLIKFNSQSKVST